MPRLNLLAAAVAAAAVVAAAQAQAEEVLRATSMLPRTLIYSESFLKFVDTVNESAAGTLRIQFVGAPEAVPTPEQPEALRNGVIDMVYGPSTYYLGMVPEVDALLGSNLDRWNAMSEDAWAMLQALAIEHEQDSVEFFQAVARDEDGEMRKRGVEVVTLDETAAARYRSAAIATAWTRLKSHDGNHHDAALREKFYRQ